MSSQFTLRGLVAYATNLVSQFPLSFNGPLANPVSLVDFFDRPASDNSVPYVPLSGAPSCPIDGPMSCHNSTPAGDSCCFVYPGGRMLLTQFWDREIHVGGAEEDWTVHGLWPDRCDGSYESFCNHAPRFNNITEILQHHGQAELLDFMNRFWIADRGPNSRLWAHEYNKHATCINTLSPACYGDAYATGFEVVDYFVRAASLFRMLDTYTALQHAGIAPSNVQRFPLRDVVAALEQFAGGRVVVRCGGPRREVLHEVWYVYFVQGSLQSGEFVPAQDLGEHGDQGNCAPWVRYPPKVPRASRKKASR